MKKRVVCFIVVGFCIGMISIQAQQSLPKGKTESFTHVGQEMPPFTVTTLDGTQFNIRRMRGKVLLINFWATWCSPCRAEMPRLEREVWQKFKSSDFVMVAIAREQSGEEINSFRKKHGFSFPMASDPQRKTFQLFASAGIPRTYVVARDGAIIYQSVGYSPAEFDRMKQVVEQELKKAR